MTFKQKLQRCIDLIDKHDEMTILEERVFFAQTIQEAQSLLEQQEKELELLRAIVGAAMCGAASEGQQYIDLADRLINGMDRDQIYKCMSAMKESQP